MINFDPHFTKILFELLAWIYKYDPSRIDVYNLSRKKDKILQEFFRIRQRADDNYFNSLPSMIKLRLEQEAIEENRDFDRRVQNLIKSI